MLHDIEVVFSAVLDLVGWGQGLGMDVVYVPQLQSHKGSLWDLASYHVEPRD